MSPGFGEILLQRYAAQQLHHQVGPPILLPGVINRAHIGMVQRGRRACFAQEAFMRQVAAGAGCCVARRVVRLRRQGRAAARIRRQITSQKPASARPRAPAAYPARDTLRPCRRHRSSRSAGTGPNCVPSAIVWGLAAVDSEAWNGASLSAAEFCGNVFNLCESTPAKSTGIKAASSGGGITMFCIVARSLQAAD